jgi:hypothetical protein
MQFKSVGKECCSVQISTLFSLIFLSPRYVLYINLLQHSYLKSNSVLGQTFIVYVSSVDVRYIFSLKNYFDAQPVAHYWSMFVICSYKCIMVTGNIFLLTYLLTYNYF